MSRRGHALRPSLAAARAVVALVVVSLVAWLGSSAAHLHLPAAPADGRALGPFAMHGAGCAGHDHAHGHDHRHDHAGSPDGHGTPGERTAPCKLCASLDRSILPVVVAGVSAARVATATPARPPLVAPPEAGARSDYRSRAPPA